jgi:hypothetical protein
LFDEQCIRPGVLGTSLGVSDRSAQDLVVLVHGGQIAKIPFHVVIARATAKPTFSCAPGITPWI